MAGLISAAEAAGIREALSVFYVHTYTRVRASSGAEDGWGDETATDGTPTTSLPCKYRQSNQAVRTDLGVTLVGTPTLKVPSDDPLTTGDTVKDIRNSEGTVLLAGPLTVGVPLSSDGLGPSLGKRFELIAATPARSA